MIRRTVTHFLTVSLLAILITAALLLAATSPHSHAQSDHLTLWIRDDWAVLVDAFAAIGANSGMELVVEVLPAAEIFNRYTEAVMAGEGPDILYGSDDWAHLIKPHNVIAPIPPGPWMEAFIPFTLQAFTIEGDIYAVPAAMENLALVRNLEMVPEAPATWEEVFEISTRIHNRDENRYGLLLPDGDLYHVYPILSGFGGYVLGQNPDGTFNPDDVGLNNPGVVEALTILHRLASEDIIPVGIDWDTSYTKFYLGESAMVIVGSWMLRDLEESTVPIAVSAFPHQAQPTRPFVHVQGFMLNPNSPQLDRAQDFLVNQLASEPNMALLQEAFYRLPAHIAVFEQIDDPNLLGFAQAAQNGQVHPGVAGIDAIYGTLPETIQLVRQGEQDPQIGLDQAIEAIRSNLE